ncbi:hypothetical protein [Veiled chameleon serpentovirus A]|uniref:Uncharacterized protein n=1 Tax=Veiled chameleon serpentovirus A TaxID=2806429 RepID=A0AAE7P763_9NIDO|nr:hypothetical protein QKS92_gp07 [Veiled chameleon serpentovirus A]QRC47054.1 hypothetical protein [Veiled chameleon serpentovirus A]
MSTNGQINVDDLVKALKATTGQGSKKKGNNNKKKGNQKKKQNQNKNGGGNNSGNKAPNALDKKIDALSKVVLKLAGANPNNNQYQFFRNNGDPVPTMPHPPDHDKDLRYQAVASGMANMSKEVAAAFRSGAGMLTTDGKKLVFHLEWIPIKMQDNGKLGEHKGAIKDDDE